jgi:hypothetical protein
MSSKLSLSSEYCIDFSPMRATLPIKLIVLEFVYIFQFILTHKQGFSEEELALR